MIENGKTHALPTAGEQDMLQAGFDAAAVGMAHADLHGRLLRINPAFCQMLGYEREAPVGSMMDEILFADQREDCHRIVSELLAGVRSHESCEKKYIRSDKSLIWVSLTVALVRTPKGDPSFLMVTAQDISPQKKAEAELHSALVKAGEYVLASDMLMLVLDNTGAVNRISRKGARLLGYEMEELTGKNWFETCVPEDVRSISQTAFAEITQGNEQQYASYENQIITRSGKRIVISWQHATIHDGDGKFMGVLSTGHNITAWKEKEAEIQQLNQELEQKVAQRTHDLQRSENLLRQAQEIARIGSWELEISTGDVIWSEELFRILGFDPAKGAPSFASQESIFVPDDWVRLSGKVSEAINEGRPYALDVDIIRPDGSIRHLHAQGQPTVDAQGRVIKLTGTAKDITERKNIETRLEKSRQELEAFSYSVSHDLRTPLRGIDGWSVALTEDFSDILPPEALQYLSRIRTETQRMGQLIDDLLTLARISRHEMKVSVVDLSEIAQRIAQRLTESAPGRNIDFVIQSGLTARGDAGLLEIMLTNLLENAFKFTARQAQAAIELRQTLQNGAKVYAVCDNGVGFNMEYAKKLFTPFQRMHRQSEFPGTGVGLATVQRVVHLHMGTIWASSAVGEGATFYFTINP